VRDLIARGYWQIHVGFWPSPSVREQVQCLATPPLVNEQVSLIVGHDQKPSRTTTSGQAPFAPDGCGIARPSGVCAAAITCSVVSPPPPGFWVGAGGLVLRGGLCLPPSAALSAAGSPLSVRSSLSTLPQPTAVSISAPTTLPTIPINPDRLILTSPFPFRAFCHSAS